MAAGPRLKAPTYWQWLAGRKASEGELTNYLGSSGEWWNSEVKAASESVDYSLRKAVCALANVGGGEIFVGVRNDRSIVGTTMTEQGLDQILKQASAPSGEWYLTDLSQTVQQLIPVPIGSLPSGRFVYVLGIVRQ